MSRGGGGVSGRETGRTRSGPNEARSGLARGQLTQGCASGSISSRNELGKLGNERAERNGTRLRR